MRFSVASVNKDALGYVHMPDLIRMQNAHNEIEGDHVACGGTKMSMMSFRRSCMKSSLMKHNTTDDEYFDTLPTT